ncbi:DEAD/DEAH box helicase [Halalkalibacter alkalisediminis]|uniref:DEAD/DEAH box helicase n=1 Tax=Halalkalibacter alkalisediminis TaxID=935616 RepID=A0ABV6NFT2_9BACI|nr:DEAD/DEAH box helicase [Halalkalibacter alkalisediminis]
MIQSLLFGKRLLLSEIPILEHHLPHPHIQSQPGIQLINGRETCIRCGNDDRMLFAKHICARCGKTCSYCRHCLQLGKVSSCQPLYHWTGPPIERPVQSNSLHWKGALTLSQKAASDSVIEAIKNQQKLLVWAVCGAGKTEVLFRGLEAAFAQGKRVLLSTPRTDVVKELSPRLQQSFPHTHIETLYGGRKEKKTGAQLVLSTTHQAMRFYRAFDVVIIDEVDAFPYSYDQRLQHAVRQAQKPNATTIYLSATPSKDLLKMPDLTLIKIPKRYHGFRLPVPRFQWCGNWQKQLQKKKLPPVLITWLQTNKPLLLFVPSLQTLQLISSLLQLYQIKHLAVHAKEPNRHRYVEAFRNGNVRLMVTTTILERGVTFADVQVAVFGAEDPIFEESALVQIAGRAGRKKEAPTGDVVYFHYGVSQEMKRARTHIQHMNKEGGFL